MNMEVRFSGISRIPHFAECCSTFDELTGTNRNRSILKMSQHDNRPAVEHDLIAGNVRPVGFGRLHVHESIGHLEHGSRAGGINGFTENEISRGIAWRKAVRAHSESVGFHDIDCIALPG